MRIPWAAALVVLAVAALLVHTWPVTLAVYTMALLWLSVWWLVGRVGRALALRQRLSATHVAPGESVEVEIALVNGSRLPVPWLWLRERLPVHLEAGASFQACGTVAPVGTTSFRFTFTPTRRGRYRIGRVDFTLGDWFGLCSIDGRMDLPLWVTVYPAVHPLPPLPGRPVVPAGPRRQPDSPFREELVLGLRDYQPGDPMRWLAWKATARTGLLQVREFPRVRERSRTLVLDMDPAAWRGPVGTRCLERALSVAASYAWAPPDGPQPVGLLAFARTVRYVADGRGVLEDTARLLRVPPASGVLHRRRLLEVLAELHPAPGPGLAQLLGRHGLQLSPGEGLVVLTSGHDEGVWGAAAAIARRRHPVVLLGFDLRALPPCAGVQVLSVTLEGDVAWG